MRYGDGRQRSSTEGRGSTLESAKVTLGINSLDLAASGGLPAGSHAVLFGGSGTHGAEFCYTAAFVNAAMKRGVLPQPEREDVAPPENVIIYLVLAKTKDDVMRDVKVSFSDDFFEIFSEEIEFKEFMSDYYASSLAPLWGAEGETKRESPEKGGGWEETNNPIEIIKLIIEFLDRNGRNSLIILDSLDDLIRVLPSGGENRLLAALRALQNHNKNRWNSLILSRLTKGVFPRETEESILSLADGVFNFEEASGGARTLTCRKFTGVTSGDLLDSKFEYDITPSGFEASKIRLLE